MRLFVSGVLALALGYAAAMPAQAQSVGAVPDSGTADAGIASKVIANVAANDTVNGAPAILGTGGNATISKVGQWQTGLVLNTTTGALTTTAALAAGVYNPVYQLCDLNSPPDCAQATETVTVIAAAIVALPDSGNADAGIASKPIANVAANDTIDGAPATLGTGGNATVAQVGTWPPGIALTPSTGAVSTTISVAPGVYSVQYQLCDRNVPANCPAGGLATDTVTVIAASINPVADSGTADAGIASKPIANVTANDTIDGAPVVLGTGGNGVILIPTGTTWPSGIALSTSTGAVTTTAAVAPGVYSSLTYQLCDLNTPKDCATAIDTVTVITPSIVAVADSGTANAGIASRPIANVASNDTVNGAPAVLGTTGNATVAQVGTWPAGIALTPSTGAVSTTIAVPAGIYSIQYQLCDKNSPPDCPPTGLATDTVTVLAAAINPVAQSGNAVAGTASTPIANIVAGDTVNGAPATLGTGGNATVAQVGVTWPAGIALNTATGAVVTGISLPPGTYNLQYQLCDLYTPPDCASGPVTVTVAAALVTWPVAGSAIVGSNATPIANVTANDSVNGAVATLGGSGNAIVAPVGTWPAGIALNTATGAITTSSSVAAGNYALQYQLCDYYSDCVTANAAVAVTQPYTEVQASATPMGDVEFDWGRDGVSCPACNFGDGNNRANWTDRSGNLWIAHLDPVSGTFISPGANDELADTTAFFWNTYGNGPEWAFSTQNGQVVSQLVYSRWQPGSPVTATNAAPGYTGAAFATQTAYNAFGQNNWTAKFLPGAIGKGGPVGTNNTNLPEASQCNTDPISLVMFKNFASPNIQDFTEDVTSASETPLLVPLPAGVTSNGIGERFVPCTHQTLLQASVPYGGTGTPVQQVFWYDLDTGVVEQLTTDATTKYAGFMFQAPDFGDNYIFFTVANHTTVEVFEQTGTNPNGSPIFTQVNSITSPDPNEPYLNSPEPFINCTPVCTTYIFATLSKTSDSQNGISEPNGLAVIALSPQTPLFNILETANSLPPYQRLDPEYYITPQGPYLYYNRIVPETGSSRYDNLGEFYINMQLGAPSGTCVGSSAEDGLVPGC